MHPRLGAGVDTVCFSFDSGHVIPNWELHVLCCFLVACALFDEQKFFSVYLCTESLVYSLCTLLFESIFFCLNQFVCGIHTCAFVP